METLEQGCRDYRRIETALRYIRDNAADQPELADLAAACGVSEYHFQRLFRRWAGISPKRFLQVLSVEHAKELLRASATVFDASLETGLSGPSRLHDLFVSCEAVTPGEYKRAGDGVPILYGSGPSPFGECFVAETPRGICALEFPDPGTVDEAVLRLAAAWPAARPVHDRSRARDALSRVFGEPDRRSPIRLHVQGTNFQIQVWRALLRIPEATVVSYATVAGLLGRPTAIRAAATAVAKNPTAYIIPCHRVIRSMGLVGRYRWGEERKRAMLARELAAGEPPRQAPRPSAPR